MAKKAETRRFRLHTQMIYDVILRQAGSLSKGLLEAVMNSADAGAKHCDISVTHSDVVVEDDGKGFRSRKEIEQWFEVFGQPHDESEGKTYGTFRMGRGQCFVYGENTWRSGLYQMVVDVKNRGLDYDLLTCEEKHPGCKVAIKLYEPLSPSDEYTLQENLSHWTRYMPLKVTYNGKVLSVDPAQETWDIVNDDAYIRFGSISDHMRVYNLGALVCDLGSYHFGIGGEIVSRQQLKVNFARNDIQDDCPVWRRIKPLVSKKATSTNLKKPTGLNDAARSKILRDIARGVLDFSDEKVCNARIFTAVNGRQYSAHQLANMACRGTGLQFSVAGKGDRTGDKLQQENVAFVMAKETLRHFDFETPQELASWFQNAYLKHNSANRFRVAGKNLDELSQGFTDRYDILEDKKLTPTEWIWLRLMRLRGDFCKPGDICVRLDATRKYFVGDALADGWTDGSSYIAVSRDFLRKIDLNIDGITQLAHLLLHEWCHDEPDTDRHYHSQEFYEHYHAGTLRLGRFVDMAVRSLPWIVKQAGRKITKKQLWDQQAIFNIAKEQVKLFKAQGIKVSLHKQGDEAPEYQFRGEEIDEESDEEIERHLAEERELAGACRGPYAAGDHGDS